jgi:RNA polymerase sigma factor (sigma-70 family)
VEQLLRELAPRVVGALTRRHGQLDACEDAVQEALLAAAQQWPKDGVPADPRAWLTTVAQRRLVDEWRSESARRRREESLALQEIHDADVQDGDDTLTLLFLCCHPTLSAPSQLALTLRAVGGLTTAEVARAFLVPEATMAQRISRAKKQIAGEPFALDPARLPVVLHVLYLIFNEGYTALRRDLAAEAIRLTRMVAGQLPDEGEVAGLLALMLLTDARRAARVDVDDLPVPLAEQDRSRWDADQVAEGISLLTGTLGRRPVGSYQLQAAIAAVHDEAPTAAATDWPQILALYDALLQHAPSPVVALNRAVAVAEVHGPRLGLAALGEISGLDTSHRVEVVRAHLLERAGELTAARTSYLLAARLTASTQEQRYLSLRAAALG